MLHKDPITQKYIIVPDGDAAQNELWEYQQLKQQAEQMEDCLAEYCSAIEDFDLACANQKTEKTQEERLIYCRKQSYTPHELLTQARQTSDQLEQTLGAMSAAKGRVLSKILQQTNNAAEYQAIRFAFVDLHDQLSLLKSLHKYEALQA